MKTFLKIFLLLAVLSSPALCRAQRQIPGRSDVALWGTFVGETGAGGGWYLNTYAGRFTVTASYGFVWGNLLSQIVTDGSEATAEPFYCFFRRNTVIASGGYQWRILSSRNRWFTVYAGPTFDIGGMFYTEPKGDAREKGLPVAGIAVGGSVCVDMEFFIFPKLSLGVFARPRFQFVSSSLDQNTGVYDPSVRWIAPVVGAGLVYYL